MSSVGLTVSGWRIRSTHRLFASVAAAAVSAAMVSVAQPARAASVPWGTVLVPGSAWAGTYAALGNLNVYSNGNGNEDVSGLYGLEYECFELAARWAQIAYGDPHNHWHAYYAYQMYDTGPQQTPAFLQRPNGGPWMPQFGDLLVFNQTSFDPAGHVAVVTRVGGGYVDIVEQNWGDPDPTGHAALPIGGYVNGVWDATYMSPRWGLPVRGWLHSTVAPGGTVQPGNPWTGAQKPAPPTDYPPGVQLLPTGGVAAGSAESAPLVTRPSPPPAGVASQPSDLRPGAVTLPPVSRPIPRMG